MKNLYITLLSIVFLCFFINAALANDGHSAKRRPPANLTTDVLNANTARLSWMGTPRDHAYTLRVRPDGVLSWTYYTVKAPTSTRRVADLIPGTVYHWQVQTQFSQRSRDTSSFITGQPFTAWEACDAPVALPAVAENGERVRLAWHSANTDALYTVKIRPEESRSWTTYETRHNRIAVAGLKPGTTYVWSVTSLCERSGLASDAPESGLFTTGWDIALVESSVAPLGFASEDVQVVTFITENGFTGNAEAMLLDAMGSPVNRLPLRYKASDGSIAFTLEEGLPPGLYNVAFRSGMEVQSQTVMIP